MFSHVIYHTCPAYQFLTQPQHLKPALQRTHMAFAIFTGIQQARITHRRAERSALDALQAYLGCKKII